MLQPDSLHPLSVNFFEGMIVRSTLFNNDVEPSHRAKYKTMEKGVCLFVFVLGFYGPFNNEVMSSRSVNSGTVPGQA